MADKYVKTITLGLDYSGFSNSIKECNDKIKLLDAEFEHANATLEGSESAADKAAMKQSYLSEKIEVQKNKVEIAKQKYDQLMSSHADTSKIMKADAALLKERTTLANLEKELDDTTNTHQMMVETITAVITTLAALASAFTECATSAAEYMDEVNTFSQQSGASSETVQTWEYMADTVDVSVETMVAAMSKLKKNMGDSASSDAVAAFDQLGVSVRDSAGELKSAETVMYETFDALQDVSNETEKDTLAMSIFGKSADQLAGAIDGGSDAFTEYNSQARECGAIIEGNAATSLQEFQDQMDQANQEIEAAKNQFGAIIAEALLPFIEAFNDMNPTVRNAIVIFATIVSALIPAAAGLTALKAAMTLYTSATKAGAAANLLFDASMLPMVAAAAAIVVGITAIIYCVSQMVETIKEVGGVSQYFSMMSDYIADVTNGVINLKAALEAVSQFFQNIANAVKKAIEALKEYATAVTDATSASNVSGGSFGFSVGHNATGVSAWRGGLTMVGEQGPELVNLPTGSRIYNNSETNNVGGNTYNISLNCDLSQMKSVSDVVKAVSGLNASRQMGGYR